MAKRRWYAVITLGMFEHWHCWHRDGEVREDHGPKRYRLYAGRSCCRCDLPRELDPRGPWREYRAVNGGWTLVDRSKTAL